MVKALINTEFSLDCGPIRHLGIVRHQSEVRNLSQLRHPRYFTALNAAHCGKTFSGGKGIRNTTWINFIDKYTKEPIQTTSSRTMTPIIIRGQTRWNRCSREIAAGAPEAVTPILRSEVVDPRLSSGAWRMPCGRELAGAAGWALGRSSDPRLARCPADCG
jgi:hypothetical protein